MEKRKKMEKRKITRIDANQYIKEAPYLPQEIMEQIMACLPVESLLRFKCVSKQWCLLISSNNFIKTHLAKSSKNKSLERHRVILGNSIVQAKQCFSPSFLQDPLATAVEFDDPMCGSWNSACVVGSCNGLVCIRKNNVDFIFWNPSTRKFKKLPSHVDDDIKDIHVYAYGFGFDESNDDYKVFCKWMELPQVKWNREGVLEQQKIVAKIYSSKLDSWRKVEDPTIGSDSELQFYGREAKGRIHWRVRDWLSGVHKTISLDLENEVFGTVEWPSDDESGFLAEVVDGCLCWICPSKSRDEADYWILKEYGAKDSWCKLATLDRLDYSWGDWGGEDPCEYYQPMIAGANGEIIFWNFDSAFILFKQGDCVLSSSGAVGALDLSQYPPVIYVESLVEP